MSKDPRRDRNKPKGQTAKPDRAAAVARDPAPGATNRPGFDLGGAVGDAKPDHKHRIERAPVQAQDAVKEGAGKVAGDARLEAEGRPRKAAGKMRSAVAGVRNWLRGRQ
jgi:uncharacterized protein YjbJ (UPF0337 family)